MAELVISPFGGGTPAFSPRILVSGGQCLGAGVMLRGRAEVIFLHRISFVFMYVFIRLSATHRLL